MVVRRRGATAAVTRWTVASLAETPRIRMQTILQILVTAKAMIVIAVAETMSELLTKSNKATIINTMTYYYYDTIVGPDVTSL